MDELEKEAIAFYSGVPKFARTTALKDFLRRLADRLEWDQLKEVL